MKGWPRKRHPVPRFAWERTGDGWRHASGSYLAVVELRHGLWYPTVTTPLGVYHTTGYGFVHAAMHWAEETIERVRRADCEGAVWGEV
jgi:hypothetical protein